MINKRKRISFSSLSMLERCGIQYDFRYNQGKKVPPSISLILGGAVDDAVSADLGAKLALGSLLRLDEVTDRARDSMVSRWDSGVILDDEWAEMGIGAAKAAAVDISVKLASLHHKEAAPRIEPTHVQREWSLTLKDSEYQIVGIIDVQEGNRAVRDTKTSKKSPPADAAAKSLQLTAYALAVNIHDGTIPGKLWFDYLVHTKQPKLVQVSSIRTAASFGHLAARIENSLKIIESGQFTPAPTDHWCCSERFCGYWHECPFAVRPVSIVVPEQGGSSI